MPTIDFDAVTEPALICVNRACIFMGFGTNAARDPAFVIYQLPDLPQFQVVPDNVPLAKLVEFKDEFGLWIVANGLRELVEAWELVMDGLHSTVLQVDFYKASQLGSPDAGRYRKREVQFSKLGIAKKFEELEKHFYIHLPFRRELESLKRARNCLSHRLGLVQDDDLNEGDSLRVCWRAFELFGRNEDGSEFTPNIEGPYPIDFPVDSPVIHRHGERAKTVKLGERLQFTPKEIKEICYTYLIAVQQTREAVVAYAKGAGAVVNIKNKENATS